MTTCEMRDRVATSRLAAEAAARHRKALAENDVRALLHLWSVPEPLPVAAVAPRQRGAWGKVELWMAKLLLPKPVAAQVSPADSAARQAGRFAAVFSAVSDATIA